MVKAAQGIGPGDVGFGTKTTFASYPRALAILLSVELRNPCLQF